MMIGTVDVARAGRQGKVFEGGHEEDFRPESCEEDKGEEPSQGASEGKIWDSVSGKELDAIKVRKARREEIEFFRKHQVDYKVTKKQCWLRTGKGPVRVKWVDVNKGDEANPEYRSRLVAMEFKRNNDGSSAGQWFSGTPPLEALRFLCSKWASTEGGKTHMGMAAKEKDDMCLLIVDVKKAHLRAPATREVYVELPPEDRMEPGDEGR